MTVYCAAILGGAAFRAAGSCMVAQFIRVELPESAWQMIRIVWIFRLALGRAAPS